MFKKVIKGQWIAGVNAMGSPTHRSYHRNPRYLLDIKELTTIKYTFFFLLHSNCCFPLSCIGIYSKFSFRVRLQTPDIKPIPTSNVTIFERDPTTLLGKEVSTSGPYTNVIQGVATNDVVLTPNPNGYVIVFSTWNQGVTGDFIAFLYSDRLVNVMPAKD